MWQSCTHFDGARGYYRTASLERKKRFVKHVLNICSRLRINELNIDIKPLRLLECGVKFDRIASAHLASLRCSAPIESFQVRPRHYC
jgi:hypothetical protein